MLDVQRKTRGEGEIITKYSTFDIKKNASGKWVVSFESSHLINPFHPHKLTNSFDSLSEAKDLIDRYWKQF